jgi:uncharacterized membrane protein YgdD (TMEM256/DUF423 family)
MERLFLLMCGVNGFLAVALGAFGAHGLRGMLASAEDGPRRLEVWQTAAHYHLVHALALGLVAYLATRAPGAMSSAAGYAFAAGILIFSGSLYALALTGVRALGAITPIGGLCFLAGWSCVVVAAWRLPR